MPSHRESSFAMMDALVGPVDNSRDWSILQAATSLLSDSDSFYEEQMFSTTDYGFSPINETPPKIIKTEPTELLPPDFQQYNAWQSKYIDYWQPQDCLFWLIHELQELKLAQSLPEIRMEKLAHIDGTTLKNMTFEEFRRMFPEHGLELYNRLQKVKSSVNHFYSFDEWNNAPGQIEESFTRYSSPSQESPMLTDLDNEPQLHSYNSNNNRNVTPVPYCSPTVKVEADSGYKSDCSEESVPEPPPPPEKRRPGRPRGTRKKKKPEKLGRLWEFIRDLLLNPLYNPSMICWENYEEGTFRFVHSDRVAKLWGSKKDNTDMNYEKLSRAMRYYYKSQVLLPVYGKRLVYKFGPTATGWRSERPIFRQG